MLSYERKIKSEVKSLTVQQSEQNAGDLCNFGDTAVFLTGVYVVHGGRYHESLDAMLCKDVVVTSAKCLYKISCKSQLFAYSFKPFYRHTVFCCLISDQMNFAGKF